jgi:tetratricopeptide (TPR) repeat protein
MWLTLWLLTRAAQADLPLPDYRDELIVAAWIELDQRITQACTWPRGSAGVGAPLSCEPAALDRAIAHAEDFLTEVTEDGRIHYLIGLAHRHAGRLAEAERALRRATTLSPERTEAWFDLGELLSQRGAWPEARAAFTRVTTLLPTGPTAWLGWLQLAQVSAHQKDAEAFERDVREALRHGFTFRLIEGQPAWVGFYADPALHDTLDRLIRYYADEAVLNSLKPSP